jgi:DNA-binding MarR family transcriptional regulator
MKALLIRILTKLTGASRELLELLIPILRDSASRLLAQLAPIALEVVKSLADSPHSGSQKREAALVQIQSLAVAEGIRASTSAVNLAIELAVANLKTK